MSRLKNLGPVMQFERQKTKRSQRQMKTKRATKKYSNFRRQVPKHKERGTFFPPRYSAARFQSTERDREGGAYHIPADRHRTSAHSTCPQIPATRPTCFSACTPTHTRNTRTRTHAHAHTHLFLFLTNVKCDVKLIRR